MTDISDGMMIDAESLARASEVTIDIDSMLLRDHPSYRSISRVSETLALEPLKLVLTSGEEHSPLFTADPVQATGLRCHRIGTVLARGRAEITLDGKATIPDGFQHF
jgi:thiamine monophosphate kinase